MLVWWHELIKDLIGRLLAVVNPFCEEMMIFYLKMREAIHTRGTSN